MIRKGETKVAIIEGFNNYFELKASPDYLSAELHLIKEYHLELSFTPDDFKEELKERKVVYGYLDEEIERVAEGLKEDNFPLVVAKGLDPENGNDGKLVFEKNLASKLDRDDHESIDLRDVIKIPSVSKGDKLVTIINPTDGENGINVYGKPVQAKPGKPAKVAAGQNTVYQESEQSIYADIDGQINVDDRAIHVFPLYEVQGNLDMKIGNLDFIGSIVIRGDVPTGFKIKAGGDVKIYGLVEGATIEAGGSVFVSEGIVPVGKGSITAGFDVQASYINQGNVEAGRHILVENSILHSHCTAKEHIECKNGVITGGSLSAGLLIKAKDVGNKMHTKTSLFFGANKKVIEKEEKLVAEKKALSDSLKKLKVIGDKLKEKETVTGSLAPKEKVMLLRQRNSIKTTAEKLKAVTVEYEKLRENFVGMQNAKLTVEGTVYTNTDIVFGKYRRKLIQEHRFVEIKLDQGEIIILPL